MEQLVTERLLIRQADTGDARFFLDLLNSPGWLRFIGDRNVRTEAEAVAYLENRILPVYATPGHGSYVVVSRGTNALLGFVGVFRRPELEFPDFGFAFLADAQGYGYAEEASLGILAMPAVRALPELLAITQPDNVRSQRLLERLGFVPTGTTPVGGVDHLRYRYG